MWHWLAPVAESAFVDARLQLHWAAQILGAAGQAYLQPRDDWSHTSLRWLRATRRFARQLSDRGISLELDPALMTLEAPGTGEPPFHLAGRTMDDGLSWAGRTLGRKASDLDRSQPPLVLLEHEMPDHPVGRGTAFGRATPDAARALGDWFSNACHLFTAIKKDFENVSSIRCWPHHFDIAVLIDIGAGHGQRTVGVGMSPGDSHSDRPYFYMSPWPYPETTALPDTPAGTHWNLSEWVGIVLPAESVWDEAEDGAQLEFVLATVRKSVQICMSLPS